MFDSWVSVGEYRGKTVERGLTDSGTTQWRIQWMARRRRVSIVAGRLESVKRRLDRWADAHPTSRIPGQAGEKVRWTEVVGV